MAEFFDHNNRVLLRELEQEQEVTRAIPDYCEDYVWANDQNALPYDATQPQNLSKLVSAALSIDEFISLPQDCINLLTQSPSAVMSISKKNLLDRTAEPFQYDPKDLSMNHLELNKDTTLQDIPGMSSLESLHQYANSPDTFSESCQNYNFDTSSANLPTSAESYIDERILNFDDSTEGVTSVSPSTVSPNSILYGLVTSGDASLMSGNAASDLQFFAQHYADDEALTTVLDLSPSVHDSHLSNVEPNIIPPFPHYNPSPQTIPKLINYTSNTHSNYAESSNINCRNNFAISPFSSKEILLENTSIPQVGLLNEPSEEFLAVKSNQIGKEGSVHSPSDSVSNVPWCNNDTKSLAKSGVPPFYQSKDGPISKRPSPCHVSFGKYYQSPEDYGRLGADAGNKKFPPSRDSDQICHQKNEDCQEQKEYPLDLRGEGVTQHLPSKRLTRAMKSRKILGQDSNNTSSFKTREQGKTVTVKSISCSECDITFPTRRLLIKHQRSSKHRKSLSCKQCTLQFYDTSSLKVHLRLHTGERPYKCELCGETFVESCSLSQHRRKHTGEKPYECSKCNKKFRLLSTLKSHRLTHTGQKPFECEVCGARFTQRSALKRHKSTHSDERPFTCDQCGTAFGHKSNFQKHLANHELKAKHMCQICGEGFNNSKRLHTHLMKHNSGDRPFKCNKCTSEFKSLKYLTQHKRRVHQHNEEIRCEYCNASFRRKETYRSHQKVHKGDSLFTCYVCKANFNHAGTLKKHIKTHDTQSNKCSVENEFKQKSKEHDSEKNSKKDLIKCEHCQLTFFRHRQLKAHTKYCNPENSLQRDIEEFPDDIIITESFPTKDNSLRSNSTATQIGSELREYNTNTTNTDSERDTTSSNNNQTTSINQWNTDIISADSKRTAYHNSIQNAAISTQNINKINSAYKSNNHVNKYTPFVPLNNAYKLLSAVFEVTDKEKF